MKPINIKIKRGAKLNLSGQAEKILNNQISPELCCLKPTDFLNLHPLMLVREGDTVKSGEAIFTDKYNNKINFVAPICGTVKEIRRGTRRKILEIIIEKTGDESIKHEIAPLKTYSQEQVIALLLKSGCWPFIKQRPYGVVADQNKKPKAIFVSTVDTAPLAVDYDFLLKNDKNFFQKGIDVLNKLISGFVHLGVDASFSGMFGNIKDVIKYNISGKHPAGNVSIHINRIMPINFGETIWTVNPEDVANIGAFFSTGLFRSQRTYAISGSAVKNPVYYLSKIGAQLKPMLHSAKHDLSIPTRCINGDVLSGEKVSAQGFANYYNNLISVIPEGNHYRMFGWLPFKDNNLPSLSGTSFSRLLYWNKKSEVTTSLNGEERALVVTGEMEKVFPMDIYPLQLIKSCLAYDIERMEALGIYEVVPEDFALVDFVNSSKISAQDIIKSGIELMLKEE